MTGAQLLCAAAVDVLMGDPRWLPHPVRVMGAAIQWCDERARNWRHRPQRLRIAGTMLAIGLPACAYAIGQLALLGAAGLAPWAHTVVTVVLASTVLAGRDLWDHARGVFVPLASGALPAARQAVGMIVGRDTADLSESEVARAAVETIAESTADGVIAPLFYLAIGGPALGLAYKAVNTLDSMIGHRDGHYGEFGWASARLDDVANWVPARLTAGLLLCGAGLLRRRINPVRAGWRVLRRDGSQHPSPNSGRPEAAMAGLLGIRLGGRNTYDGVAQDRPVLGAEGRSAVPTDINQALAVMVAASTLGLGAAVWWRWGWGW